MKALNHNEMAMISGGTGPEDLERDLSKIGVPGPQPEPKPQPEPGPGQDALSRDRINSYHS